MTAKILFQPELGGAPRLLTNEWAYYSPGDTTGAFSADWTVTGGSLFSRNGSAWSGVPDDRSPDAASSQGTGSAIFRLISRRSDLGDVAVSMSLLQNGLVSTSTTPAVAWDGVHIFLRYQSEFSLYYASVGRRDGHMVIKKKCPGGTENGGTYYELGAGEISGQAIPYGSWLPVRATVLNAADGTVRLTVERNGRVLITATDSGVGCAPIRSAGATGIRGDNADFQFKDFVVTEL